MTSPATIPAPVVPMLTDEEKALVDLLAEIVVEAIFETSKPLICKQH